MELVRATYSLLVSGMRLISQKKFRSIMKGKFQRPEFKKIGETRRQLTAARRNEIPKP
jgi:hypothetical protein